MSQFSTWDLGACGCPGTPQSQSFTVKGCNAIVYPGVTVSVYDTSGGTLLQSGTTDGSGNVTLAWTGAAATWVEVTGMSGRFNAFGVAITVNPQTLQLTAATGYVCFPSCLIPLPTTLQLTDSVIGNATLSYNGSSAWAGSKVYSYPGYTCPGFPSFDCPAATVTVHYSLSTGGTLTVSWNAFIVSPGFSLCPNDLNTATGFWTRTLASAASFTCPLSFSVSWDLIISSGVGGDTAYTAALYLAPADCGQCTASPTCTITTVTITE
jgi:hypothetical protein